MILVLKLSLLQTAQRHQREHKKTRLKSRPKPKTCHLRLPKLRQSPRWWKQQRFRPTPPSLPKPPQRHLLRVSFTIPFTETYLTCIYSGEENPASTAAEEHELSSSQLESSSELFSDPSWGGPPCPEVSCLEWVSLEGGLGWTLLGLVLFLVFLSTSLACPSLESLFAVPFFCFVFIYALLLPKRAL